MILRAILSMLVCTCALPAQVLNRQIQYVSVAPSGTCASTAIDLHTPNGTIYTCQNGTWASRFHFTQTASVTVANTTDETSVLGAGSGTATFPANYFTSGTTFEVRVMGIHTATGNPTIRWRVKLGAVTILDSTAVQSQTSTNQAINLLGVFTCRTAGAGGTGFAQGSYTETGNFAVGLSNTSTSAIDTTSSLPLDVTVQWGTASPSDSITVTNLIIDIL